jgi:shikimate dehydrogenase
LKYRLALIGNPVSHSLSPPMHNAALTYCHLEGSYGLLDIAPADLEREIDRIKLEGYTGFNVTIPHKDAIYRMAKEHTKECQQAQASNTVKIRKDGSLLAHNTDIGGFKEALEELLSADAKNERACIIGTGGAAKAAILGLAELGFEKIHIISRDAAKADALAQNMKAVIPAETELVPSKWEDVVTENLGVIVNSTPIGQNALPVPDWVGAFLAKVPDDALLFDMVYTRSTNDTPLVIMAKERGLNAVDGAEMLIRQAQKAFQFWTGESTPVEIFRTAFETAK